MTRVVAPLVMSILLLVSLLLEVSANKKPPSPKSFSKKLNSQVEDLYVKAEKLQDRAFQRVYELQRKAQDLQDRALRRSQQLEQQSQSILEKATKQAKELQQEAAHNLGELKSVVEGLPIKTSFGSDEEEEEENELVVQEEGENDMEVIDLGDGVSVEVPLDESEEIELPIATVVVKNKWQNVRERTMPAVVMLSGLYLYVHFGGSFIPLVFLIQFGLFAETAGVVNLTGKSKWWWFCTAVVATNGHLLGWKHADAIAYGMGVLGLVAWVIQQNAAKEGAIQVFQANLASLAATALSLLVLVGQSSFWIATLQEFGLTWILYPAFLVIVNDTMAYVFGMLFGKHPLLPIISPKKTWEGFTGATLSTLGASYPLLSKMMATDDNTWRHAIVIATYVSLVSPFGGFLASIVKRAHGKKDFANWIQGHGGTVDRLDCQVITAPFVYYYLSTFLVQTTT